jgi:hypothetical protein
VLDVAFSVGTVTSAVRGLVALAGGDRLGFLFDTNPGVAYSFLVDGARLRGVFSEPSELAAFALPALVWFTVSATRSSGREAALRWIAAVIAAVDLVQASSGTAVVASALVVGGGAVVLSVRYVLRGGRGTPWIVLGALVVAVVVLWAGDALAQPVAAIVHEKIGSQSYDSRTGGDRFSWGVLVQSWGLGVGVGGNRPSSFGLSLLSCVGVPGTIAFAALLGGVLVAALRNPSTVAAGSALVALLVAKVVGTPDLSTPVLWLLIAVCAVPAWQSAADPRQGKPARLAPLRLDPIRSDRNGPTLTNRTELACPPS